jgi:hypothetical protein
MRPTWFVAQPISEQSFSGDYASREDSASEYPGRPNYDIRRGKSPREEREGTRICWLNWPVERFMNEAAYAARAHRQAAVSHDGEGGIG